MGSDATAELETTGLEEETAALGGKLRELEKGLAKKELSLRDEGQRLFRESIRLAGF